MRTVNMLEAKTQLSKLVDAVERGEVDEIVIARDGKPAARLVPLSARRQVKLGVAKGRYDPAQIEAMFTAEIDAAILELFQEASDAADFGTTESFLLDPNRLRNRE